MLSSDLGSVYLFQERLTEAERLFRGVIEVLQHTADTESVRVLAKATSNLAEVLSLTNRTPEAAQYARSALALLEAVDREAYPENIVKALTNVALFAAQDEGPGASEALFSRAIALAEQVFGPDSPLVGDVLSRYALFLRQQKRNGDARKIEERSTQILSASQRSNSLGFTVESTRLMKAGGK